MSWVTEQVCDECWLKRHGSDQHVYRMKEEFREEEPCYLCRQPTKSGIYERLESIL